MLNQSYLGSGITGRVARGIPQVPYPQLFLAHQATELFLKSISLSLGLARGSSHDTWRLFNALTPIEHQESILEYYEHVLNQASQLHVEGRLPDAAAHFSGTLKSIGPRYNDLRYIFEEGRTLPTNQVLNSGFVMEAIRRYALERLLSEGDLHMLLVQAEEADGEMVEKPGGEKCTLNRNTPNLRAELNRFFGMALESDPFNILRQNPVMLSGQQ